MLIEYGANHNTALERAAKAKRYQLLLELIKKHYHDHPNKNETESAKRKILGDLLFTLGEKQEKNTFAALLAQGADITLNQDESCLLSHLTKHKSWDCMKVLLSEFPLGSPFNQSQVHQSIIQAINSNAPDDIMTKLFSMTAADIKDITCNNTGNNALHAAVQADNPEAVEKYLAIGVDPHAKNKAKQTPYTLLLKLDHDEKSTLKQSEKMALLLAKTDEHIQGNKFEKITDNMQVKSVIASRITCLRKLAARYNPAPSFASARDEYTAFVEAQQDYDTTKKDSYYFRFGDECVKTALPLVWSAIKDETALPANAPEWLKEDSETGKRNRAIYVETRKKSLIEKLQQAAEGKSCDNGTVTKILEAINLAHPDVVIVYDKQQIIGEIQDNVRHFMATKMDILVASLPPQEQRALYREVQLDEDNDNIPKVFHLASQHLATSLIPQYGSFEETITLDEINQLISPKRLSYIMNLSWPNDIKNVHALVNEIMAVTETPHEAAAKYLTVAQELASHVFEPDNQHSFLDDIASLQKAWTDYKDALAAKQLAIVSFIGGTSPATTQSVDAEPYKADCFTK